ncbi:MAG TPA: hypothetical protein PKD00_01535 [Burkholderiales bacterium]|nr:hypothetical protein [Burkholderiales bacterium]
MVLAIINFLAWIQLYCLVTFCIYDIDNKLLYNRFTCVTIVEKEINDSTYISTTYITDSGCIEVPEKEEYYIILSLDNNTSYFIYVPGMYDQYNLNLSDYNN